MAQQTNQRSQKSLELEPPPSTPTKSGPHDHNDWFLTGGMVNTKNGLGGSAAIKEQMEVQAERKGQVGAKSKVPKEAGR